ncbi:hypothetical protein [Limnohabitans sp. DM1]|uniref:hypothetical protein n=1 Tax=Limnohabitans sp. DM1 TaxID=1597955 RepID=UPI000A3FABA5|nr:hypothetical protein [Limnohabitans sp. DM1]
MNTNTNFKAPEVDLLDELSTNPELLFIALQQPISFNPVLVDITQSLTAGLFLSTALEEAHGDWVDLDQEKIKRTTRLTNGELKGARQRLRDLDLLHERRIGFPSRTQYSINFDKLKTMLVSLSRLPSQAHVQANGPTALH